MRQRIRTVSTGSVEPIRHIEDNRQCEPSKSLRHFGIVPKPTYTKHEEKHDRQAGKQSYASPGVECLEFYPACAQPFIIENRRDKESAQDKEQINSDYAAGKWENGNVRNDDGDNGQSAQSIQRRVVSKMGGICGSLDLDGSVLGFPH